MLQSPNNITTTASFAARNSTVPNLIMSKTERNERSMWRTMARAIRFVTMNRDDDDDVECCTRRHRESETLDVSDDGNDDTKKQTSQTLAKLSHDEVRRLIEYFYEKKYASMYIRSLWMLIYAHNRTLTPIEFTHLQRELGGDSVRSRKSDGRLTFTECEYEILLRKVTSCIRQLDDRMLATNNDLSITSRSSYGLGRRKFCLFLYVFYLLAYTGKRLSDIAEITLLQLEQLHTRGVCVIKIRKTRKLGRIEISEILHHNNTAPNVGSTATTFTTFMRHQLHELIEKINEERADNLTKSIGSSNNNNKQYKAVCSIRSTIEIFMRWIKEENHALVIPFSVQRERRHLDRELTRLYSDTFARDKPRGLSFHALRRIYAGYKFLQGIPIERLRENLDHDNRSQTNKYVNSCLYEIINKNQ